jgi:hypothetical protein
MTMLPVNNNRLYNIICLEILFDEIIEVIIMASPKTQPNMGLNKAR